MKIVFYNVEDFLEGPEQIESYLSSLKNKTDIFCLQEVYNTAKEGCEKVLSGFTARTSYDFPCNDKPFR